MGVFQNNYNSLIFTERYLFLMLHKLPVSLRLGECFVFILVCVWDGFQFLCSHLTGFTQMGV